MLMKFCFIPILLTNTGIFIAHYSEHADVYLEILWCLRSYRINICELLWLLIIAISEPSNLRKNSAHYFTPKFKILYAWRMFCKDFSSLGQKIQLKQPMFVLFLRHSTARILRQYILYIHTFMLLDIQVFLLWIWSCLYSWIQAGPNL